MPLVGTLARSPLFHTLVGRNPGLGVSDSGAIPNLSQLRVSPPHTHITSSNILEDCLSPGLGDCAHIHIGMQPSGEVSGQGWGEYRVQSLSHPLFRHTIRDDRSRGTEGGTARQHNAQNERDSMTDCRLPLLSAAAHFRCILAGGTPFFQPTEMGGMHSSGSTWPARHSLSPVFQTAGVKSRSRHSFRTRCSLRETGPPLPPPRHARESVPSTIREKIRI